MPQSLLFWHGVNGGLNLDSFINQVATVEKLWVVSKTKSQQSRDYTLKSQLYYMVWIKSFDVNIFKFQVLIVNQSSLDSLHSLKLRNSRHSTNSRHFQTPSLKCLCNFKSQFLTWSWWRVSILTVIKPKSLQTRKSQHFQTP
jgi:hypothetical protein